MMKHVTQARLADAEAEQETLTRENADLRRLLYNSKFIHNPIRPDKVLDSIGE
jgi:hypothetical protein